MITAEKQLKLLPGRQRSNVPQNFSNELYADMRARQDSTKQYQANAKGRSRFGGVEVPELELETRQRIGENCATAAELHHAPKLLQFFLME